MSLGASRLSIARETIFVVIFLALSLCSVRGGKSESCWEPLSGVELHEKFVAEVSLVSRCRQDLLRMLLQILQKSRDPMSRAATERQVVSA